MSEFRSALDSGRILLLDGGMGTMLQAAGMPAGACPERFCLERPDILRHIQTAYVAAGADILTCCTFGGNPFKLPPDMDVIAFNRRMAEEARLAAATTDRRVFVAGNLGPSGHFLRPLGDVAPEALLEAYRKQVRGLLKGGVDLFFVETQFDLAEARAIVAAVRQECTLPVMVSMTFENGVCLTGSSPEIFAETMQNMGVDALGTNCSVGPELMLPVVETLVARSQIPVLVEPNAGLPELVEGRTVFRLDPAEFAEKTAAFVDTGARILGGCCGTTPAHIAALREALRHRARRVPVQSRPSGIVLTTRSHVVRIGPDAPFTIIGERINPTGKKKLTEALQAGEFSLALRFAEEQLAQGASVLDVNVGAPLVDETRLLPELTQLLGERFGVPLSLDSSNAEALARALPYCPGSTLINSVSGETGRMETLGPLCRDWGAPFILLPLRGRKLPVMAAERIAILEELLHQAETLGIPRRLLLVDVLALSVSAKPEAGRQCLETVRWCTQQGLPTTIGLSNISFGLPARELLNTAFLGMAAGAGLTSCIANPSSGRLWEMCAATDALLHKDPQAARYIAGYAQWTPGEGERRLAQGPEITQAVSVEEAVLRGQKEQVEALVEAELARGADPLELVQRRLIPAITEVGNRYERREYFLPQLLRSAETMQLAFHRLKPLLEEQRGTEKRPVVVLATVEGDIHDIGKNIVGLMLGNHGFEVVDAGKDVKAEDIVNCAVRHKARIIGLSALMTTTMVRMEDTIRLVRERGLPIRIMVGGAVVTQAFADAVGADGYAADAVGAVRLAQSLLD